MPKLLRAAVVAAVSTLAIVASAGAGSAETTYGTHVSKNGVWKAYGKWTPSTKTLCIRGYNNPGGALVQAQLRTNSNFTVQAYGNNSNCWVMDPSIYVRPSGTLVVSHYSPSGGPGVHAEIQVN